MKWIFIVVVCISLIACSSETVPDKQDNEQKIQASEKIIAEFQSELKTELIKAMSQGGPENAVTVCNTKAAEIEARFNEMPGVEIRRVSLRQRNSRYSPDEFENIVLKTFSSLKANEPQVHSELMPEGDGNENQVFRYMKEIKVGRLCLNCHGNPDNFSDDLKSKLAALYPDDSATGYNEGDSRGAFSVLLTFPAAEEAIASLTTPAGK